MEGPQSNEPKGLEVWIFTIQWNFNQHSREYAVLGLIIVAPSVSLDLLVTETNPQKKSRADYPIETAAAQLFYRKVQEKFVEARKIWAERRPTIDPEIPYSLAEEIMQKIAAKELEDGPMSLAFNSKVTIGVEGVPPPTMEMPQEDRQQAFMAYAQHVTRFFLPPQHVPTKSGLLIPNVPNAEEMLRRAAPRPADIVRFPGAAKRK